VNRADILGRCSLLYGAADSLLQALADETGLHQVGPEQTVVSKGESGSTMYFIVSGKVRVHDEDAVLAWLGEGEVFGEMSVLDSEARSASVTAEQDTVLLSLEQEVFWRVISTSPDTFRMIIRSVMQRERAIIGDVTSRTRQLLAYEKELEIGRRIQSDFLPNSLPSVAGWEIASRFEAAREVAGDFFDLFKLKSSDHLAIVIGDVCDKGVGAALFMTLFRSLIRATCLHGSLVPPAPSAAAGEVAAGLQQTLSNSIEATNRYVATTHGKSSMFASVFFALLDPGSGELFYINGGHESPILFRASGDVETLEVTGGVLGLFPWARFEVARAQLRPGDLMFAYTDGVNEAKNLQGEQFGDHRVLAAGAVPGIAAGDLLGRMLDQIGIFRGSAAQSDDITMLALRWLGSAAGSQPRG
jgi:sigma-B regulation protein RsbU (phosphoserine phosphatase)